MERRARASAQSAPARCLNGEGHDSRWSRDKNLVSCLMRRLNPSNIHPPFANYPHGVEVGAGHRLVFCSGQLGIDPDGTIPETTVEQARLCFRAIEAILGEAGMTLADIVKLNAYVTAHEHLAGYMQARDEFVAAPPPASTLMIVQGFARKAFNVEVEAIAARAD
jgi:enamine deaminase RidA (YjgF/YER057c/UK114 family)